MRRKKKKQEGGSTHYHTRSIPSPYKVKPRSTFFFFPGDRLSLSSSWRKKLYGGSFILFFFYFLFLICTFAFLHPSRKTTTTTTAHHPLISMSFLSPGKKARKGIDYGGRSPRGRHEPPRRQLSVSVSVLFHFCPFSFLFFIIIYILYVYTHICMIFSFFFYPGPPFELSTPLIRSRRKRNKGGGNKETCWLFDLFHLSNSWSLSSRASRGFRVTHVVGWFNLRCSHRPLSSFIRCRITTMTLLKSLGFDIIGSFEKEEKKKEAIASPLLEKTIDLLRWSVMLLLTGVVRCPRSFAGDNIFFFFFFFSSSAATFTAVC